ESGAAGRLRDEAVHGGTHPPLPRGDRHRPEDTVLVQVARRWAAGRPLRQGQVPRCGAVLGGVVVPGAGASAVAGGAVPAGDVDMTGVRVAAGVRTGRPAVRRGPDRPVVDHVLHVRATHRRVDDGLARLGTGRRHRVDGVHHTTVILVVVGAACLVRGVPDPTDDGTGEGRPDGVSGGVEVRGEGGHASA